MANYLGENTILSLFSSLFSMGILVYFLKKLRKSALTYSFLFYLLIVFLYPLDNVVHELLISMGIYEISYHKFICRTLQYFSMSYIGAGWLIFCICFTVEKKKFVKLYTVALLLLSTILFIIELERRQNIYSLTVLYMEQFWFKTITTVIFILAGIFLLLKYRVKKSGFVKKQATLLIMAIAVPLISIMLQAYCKAQYYKLPMLFANRFINFDIVPIGFTASCLIIAISTVKYRFLNLACIASNKIYEKMKEAFIAIDINDIIINFNPAFYLIFSQITEVNKNEGADVFYKDLKSYALSEGNADIITEIQNASETPIQGEISMVLQERKYYSVNIQPIFLNNELVGRTISFTEITSYKDLLLELNEKNTKLSLLNRELNEAYEQLKKYASSIEQIAVIKERNRLAGEIHDTLGHTLTLLLTLIKASQITLEKDTYETGKKLEVAIDIIKSGLKELKSSIIGMTREEIFTNDLIIMLNRLVDEARVAGIEVELSIDGSNAGCNQLYAGVIYRICQEATTNSIRHGKARNISIVLRFSINIIKILIIDDGKGCGELHEGFGLSGMKQRIKDLNGKIEYGSDGENGFSIFAEIPFENSKDTHKNGEE